MKPFLILSRCPLHSFCTFLGNEEHVLCPWFLHNHHLYVELSFVFLGSLCGIYTECYKFLAWKKEVPPGKWGIHSSLLLPCQSQQILTSNERDGPLKLKRSCFSYDGIKKKISVSRKFQRENIQAGRMFFATAVWIDAIWTTFSQTDEKFVTIVETKMKNLCLRVFPMWINTKPPKS